MLRGGILNSELNHVLASMGHGDLLIVCDAGFPIPREAWRVDLAITRDFPDLVPVLEIIAGEFIAEKVMFAHEVVSNNTPLHRNLERIFAEAALEAIPHQTILGELAHKAKASVMTFGMNELGYRLKELQLKTQRLEDIETYKEYVDEFLAEIAQAEEELNADLSQL